ncbi:hypothetical protein BDW62DRAFT_195930 [Aspergillus aurantiobrunneus]
MEPGSPENHDDNCSLTPQTPGALQRQLEGLSLSQEDSNTQGPGLNPANQSNQDREHDEPDVREEGSSRIYRISTRRKDSDEPEPEEEKGSSNVKPDELLNILFNFDAPREIDLSVKIKGDFNVTILA